MYCVIILTAGILLKPDVFFYRVLHGTFITTYIPCGMRTEVDYVKNQIRLSYLTSIIYFSFFISIYMHNTYYPCFLHVLICKHLGLNNYMHSSFNYLISNEMMSGNFEGWMSSKFYYFGRLRSWTKLVKKVFWVLNNYP